jgi:hypothetical protein
MSYDHPKPWLERPPSKCANTECDHTVVGDGRWKSMSVEVRQAKGLHRHAGYGLCQACYSRQKRNGTVKRQANPNSRPKPKRAPELCAGGCGWKVAHEPDLPNHVRRHRTRGLCHPCARKAEANDTLLDRPARVRSNDEVLEEWTRLRTSGVFDLRVAAERMGMSYKALEKALWRGQKRGDPRAVRAHRNLRSDAA